MQAQSKHHPTTPAPGFLADRQAIARLAAKLAALTAAAHWVAGLPLPLSAITATAIIAAADQTRRFRIKHATAHGYGPTPTNLRLLGYGMFLIPAFLAAGYIAQRITNHQLQNSLRAATVQADALTTIAPPGGFAAHCFDLYLAAGPNLAGARFDAVCNPGVAPGELEGMTAATLQATGTTALTGPGLSYETSPGYYSVLLATQLRSWQDPTRARAKGKGKQRTRLGRFVDLGPAYFRVAVKTDTRGHLALRGLPRQVASPVATTVPDMRAQLGEADLDDPRSAVIADLLSRYLKAPPAGKPRAGDIGQYLAPSVKATTVHSPAIVDVQLVKTAYTPPGEGETVTRALAEVKVTYRGGRSAIQTYPLEMVQPGSGQWQITAMPGTPQLNDTP